jgi:hypothetical protein
LTHERPQAAARRCEGSKKSRYTSQTRIKRANRHHAGFATAEFLRGISFHSPQKICRHADRQVHRRTKNGAVSSAVSDMGPSQDGVEGPALFEKLERVEQRLENAPDERNADKTPGEDEVQRRGRDVILIVHDILLEA